MQRGAASAVREALLRRTALDSLHVYYRVIASLRDPTSQPSFSNDTDVLSLGLVTAISVL